MAIAVYDDFDNAVGEFPNYDTYDTPQRTQLAAQKHVDIRSFEQSPITAPYTMYELDALAMAGLDPMTMSQLENGRIVQPGELWTAGAVGPQADRNHFNGISLTCTTGANPTSSVISPIQAVNVSSFANPDYISLALPNFPLASLTLASTFIDFTSEPNGNFGTGPTDSIPFTASTTTLTASNCEARFPVSLLATINKAAITGVRFRIQATGSCTFRCLAIRCMASTWEYGTLDQNTLYDRLGATVPPTGNLAQAYAFPIAGAPVTPSDWPVLFFSDNTGEPRLVDIETGVVIHTGSNLSQSRFTLYFREASLTVRTVLSLDGLTMGQLDVLGPQMESTPGTLDDITTARLLRMSFQWGPVASVHVKDQDGAGYDFSTTLASQTDYYVLTTLTENSIRVRVYPVSIQGFIDWSTITFDSTAIIDDGFIPRRKGRFGWYAQLADGDTYVKHLRPRRIVYSEYRSLPLTSETPVDGAQIYVSDSPDKELLAGVVATQPGTKITLDNTKSSSGKAIKVQCTGNLPLQGIIAVPMRVENLWETSIEFDLLAPTGAKLEALLYSPSEVRFVPLYMPPLKTNRWRHISIPLATIAQRFQPGIYEFILIQTHRAQNTWYLDNLTISTQAITWQGRGQAADPWRMNNPAWIPFGNTINDPFNGALLGRGKALQVRSQGLRQGATMDNLKILPKYAGLGNFVWPEQAPTYGSPPVANLASSIVSGTTFAFDGTTSTAANGIANWYWTFGDGFHDYGAKVIHTYEAPGDYIVTLTVIDKLDLETSVCEYILTPYPSSTLYPSPTLFP